MTEIVFATNNTHKLFEIREEAVSMYKILSLNDIGFSGEIPEDYDTLEANARQKAEYIFDRYGIDCFADDTGLEIEALNGMPGVYSARYAGLPSDSVKNMQKVMTDMEGIEDRRARFRCVIHLIMKGQHFNFEGIVNGTILKSKTGTSGFGYDPIFLPDGYNQSFAEMDIELKNKISHRGIAVRKLISFLKG